MASPIYNGKEIHVSWTLRLQVREHRVFTHRTAPEYSWHVYGTEDVCGICHRDFHKQGGLEYCRTCCTLVCKTCSIPKNDDLGECVECAIGD